MKINIEEFEKRVKSRDIKKFTDLEEKYLGWCYSRGCQYHNNWDEYTIFARGIITTKDGEIVSRPFPKFFNIGDPLSEPLDWKDNIEVTEKLDGSLIILSFHKDNVIVTSKGSFKSEHAQFARGWLEKIIPDWIRTTKTNPKSEARKYTYCFEAIFPEKESSDQKVINYGDKSDLTLLAVIETETGREYSYEQIKSFADRLKIPVVEKHSFDNIEKVIESCKSRSISEGEGIVLHFINTNKRLKVKSKSYLEMFRLISYTSKSHVLDVMISGQDIEQVYEKLPDEFYNDVKQWKKEFEDRFNQIKGLAEKANEEIKSIPNKKWQQQFLSENKDYSEIMHVVFAIRDNKRVNETIWRKIKNELKEEGKNED